MPIIAATIILSASFIAEQAWTEPKRTGWIYYWPDGNKNLTGYVVCPKCAKDPPGSATPTKRKARNHR